MCDRQCQGKSFQYYDIASVIVEDDGELHTINTVRKVTVTLLIVLGTRCASVMVIMCFQDTQV